MRACNYEQKWEGDFDKMNDIVIYGTGGHAREIAQLIEIINENKGEWTLIGFLDDNEENVGKVINGYEVLGTSKWLLSVKKEIGIVIGIGSPKTKKIIFDKLKGHKKISFPNVIHPNVSISKRVKLGNGNLICEGAILTCDIVLKSFVSISPNCTIGHDSLIENYCTILPNSSISGNVHLKEGVYFGTNATIIQGITVGENSIIGAGAVVIQDIPANCTAVGVPAKSIKFHQ